MYMDKKVLKRPVQHAERCREKRTILGIPVDRFCGPLASEDHLGLVLSFLSCFWHRCEKSYKLNRDEKLFMGSSMDCRLESTRAIAEWLRKANYSVSEMWECDFDKELDRNAKMRHFIEEECDEIIRMKPLNVRDAFFFFFFFPLKLLSLLYTFL